MSVSCNGPNLQGLNLSFKLLEQPYKSSLVEGVLETFPYRVFFEDKHKLPLGSSLRKSFFLRMIGLLPEEDKYKLPTVSPKLTLAEIDQVLRRVYSRTKRDWQLLFIKRRRQRTRTRTQQYPLTQRADFFNPKRMSIIQYKKDKQAVKDFNLFLFAQKLYDYGIIIPITEELSLSNKARNIREWFSKEENQEKVNQIKELELAKLGLTQIPEEIEYFKNLKILDVSQNKISYIQSNLFDKNVKLRILIMNNNSLKYLPENFLEKNTRLTHLNLSKNLLEVLPKNFLKKNTRLEFLNINYNKLNNLPEDFLSNNRNMGSFFLRRNLFDEAFYSRRLAHFQATIPQIEWRFDYDPVLG